MNQEVIDLKDVERAQKTIEPVIRKTETEKSVSLSSLLKAEVFLKAENQQYTGSFKLRGAYNKVIHLSEREKAKGVIACSAGNHAQGVAFSANKAGVRSIIVMPLTSPMIKVEATKSYGAEVIQYGEIFDETYEKARALEKTFGYTFMHPYEDPLIIAGQGTIGLEVLAQLPDLDTVVVPIGGGGLISGIAVVIKTLRPQCRVIGVQSAQAPSMHQLFHHQGPSSQIKTHKKKMSTIADGIAVKYPSEFMYKNYISRFVDDIVTVSEDEIAEAIVLLLERSKLVTEGSGAVGVAALLNRSIKLGRKACVILSGGNIDLNIISKVIEKGQIRKGRLVKLSVVVDDTPGNLNRLTKTIAELRANVLEVHHDRISQGLFLRETQVDFVLEVSNKEHILEIRQALEQTGGRIL